MEALEKTLKNTHDWTLKRVEFLSESNRHDDAFSVVQEFSEWLDMENEDHDIFSLEYIGDH